MNEILSGPTPTTEQKVIVQAPTPTTHFPSLEAIGGWASAIIGMATLATLIYNFLMRDVKRDIRDTGREIEAIKHSHKNLKTEVQALDHMREKDVERIVKLETNLASLEKGQDRIEKRLDGMAEDSADARKEIIESIRELRAVAMKGG